MRTYLTYLEVLKPLFPIESLRTILLEAGTHVWASKCADAMLASWMTVVKEYVDHQTSPYGSVPLSYDLLPASPGETFSDPTEDVMRPDWLARLMEIVEHLGLKTISDEDLYKIWSAFDRRVFEYLNGLIDRREGYDLFEHEGRIYGARFYRHVVILYWRPVNKATT